jgi:DNA-directed RNA polymerase beta' subunit
MFMKMKCLACHDFRLAKRQCRVFCTKLHLLDVGRIKEALELEEGLASAARMAGGGRLDNTTTATNSNNSKHEMVMASARAMDDYLDNMLTLGPQQPPHPNTSASTVTSSSSSTSHVLDDDTNHAAAAAGGTNNSLTLHERAARRIVLKEFQSACTKALKCANCSAFSPKVRHDQYNKIFMMPLAARNKKANLAERVRIRSACSIVGSMGGAFYDEEGDEDDNWPDSEDEVEMHVDDDEESEEEDDDHDDDDIIDNEAVESGKKSVQRASRKKNANSIDQNEDVDATLGGPRVSRKASVSTSKLAKDVQDKQDNFMNTLEVEAQCRLTWEKQPYLCSKFFGSAHSPDVGESGGGGGGSSSDYDATYVTEEEDNNDIGYNSQTRRRQRARSLSNVEQSMSAGKGYTLFFLRVVPVPPSRFRPPVAMGSLIVEHSQNYYLSKVIELNAQLRTLFNVAHELIREEGELKVALGNAPDDGGTNIGRELKKVRDEKEKTQANSLRIWVDLQTTVNCFMDSTRDPRGGKAAASNVPNGIRQLLEKKEGIFRKHMMGKRVNFACRSVISPDPYIGTNEIGLPLYFAKTLTFPTPVTALNLTEMQKLVRRGPSEYPGAVWVEFPNGQRIDLSKMKERGRDAIAARLLSTSSSSGVGVVKVGRQLKDGDMVLMNRQVSLYSSGRIHV